MNFEQLGNIIRERRNELSLSQENLSNQSDVAIKTIHSVELGKANPSIKTLEKILENLGLEIIVVNRKV
jgi:transcriptional regulator with XRE-family HTH domain